MTHHPKAARRIALTISTAALPLFAVFAVPGPARAAEGAGDGRRIVAVSELVVTSAPTRGFASLGSLSASKSDTPLMEIPRSVSVVTADEIRNRGADTVTQIFQYSAGFNGDAYGGGSLSRTFTNVRGFLAFQYLDGLKLHDSNWGIESYGLQRAELFKGPPSALYGQANPGGVLALTSKRPTDQPFGEAAVQVGTHDRLQGQFDVGGRLGDSPFSYRLTAMARAADTEVEHTRDNRIYVAPALAWKVGDNTDLTLLATYQWDPKLTVFQYLPRLGSVAPGALGRVSRTTYLSEPTYDNTTKAESRLALLFEHRLQDVTLRSNLRYSYIDINARFLQAGGALGADQRTVARTAVLQEYVIAVAQMDSQLTARLRTGPLSHDILAGVDYAYIPSYQGTGTRAGPSLDLYAPRYDQAVVTPLLATKRQQHQRQTGAYVQNRIQVGGLSVLLGVRRDAATSSTRNRNAVTGVAPLAVKQRDTATTGQAGAIYNLASGFAPYVNYATSFYPTPGADFFGAALLPSRGEQYEAGVKYQPPGSTAVFTAAVFDVTQTNVRTADPAHPGFVVQTGEIRSKGYELEGRANFAGRINLALAYTRLDNEVTRSTTANLGKAPAGRPRTQASAWIDYDFDPALGLTVGAGVRHVGKSFGDANNTFTTPAYTTLDALVRYDFSRMRMEARAWDISVNALNLLDRRYVANCDTANQCFYGQGRLVKATLRRRW